MSRVQIYDTTLRDGTQAEGISFSVEDKIRIAERLAAMGVDYLEGGWPGSNPNSVQFLNRIRSVPLRRMKVAAFGSTRRADKTPANDPNIRALLATRTPVVTIFGKSWDFHVKHAIRVPLETNIEMIADSVSYLKSKRKEVIYDAEHFFEGFINNREYALATLTAARDAGADCLCLCETNGGCIPSQVSAIVAVVRKRFPESRIGIHAHNDSGCGVANSLVAIEAGASHVQGTINGYGERCGNANLIPIVANLELKMGKKTIGRDRLRRLTEVSHFVDELANQAPDVRAPYVGRTCFTHKGGIHVSAVLRNARTYEHIDPELVGNRRRVVVSDQSGRSNLEFKIREMGMKIDSRDPAVVAALAHLKELENRGYEFEGADASFAILLRKALGELPRYFEKPTWRVLSEYIGEDHIVLATVKAVVAGQEEHAVVEGDGPVNALDLALRKALNPFYPEIERLSLIDYKVRVLNADKHTGATVRVLIRSSDGSDFWSTVGVSENVIEASWIALLDSIEYFLFEKCRLKARKARVGGPSPRRRSSRQK